MTALSGEFRPDINALRAFAVASVVLYHLGVPGFGGGFSGVDVFFVISGYLMTRIILTRQAAGQFSLLDFYLARARRIVPALAFLVAVLLLAGYRFLPSDDFHLLGKHAGASLAFISNWPFRQESGYFDAAAHDKWLLHTWSLSVEWQFYLVFPVLLSCLGRFRRHITLILMMLALVSLCWSMRIARVDPVASFYLLPARAWEMLAGGLAFLLPGQGRGARYVAVAGLSVLLLGTYSLDPAAGWPGLATLWPVLATMSLLRCQDFSLAWMNSSLVQWLGRMSYSLYLWHWPVIVAGHYFFAPRTLIWQFGELIGALGLSLVSFTVVEKPWRKVLELRSNYFNFFYFSSIFCFLGGLAMLFALLPDPRQLPPAVVLAERESVNFNPRMGECLSDRSPLIKDCRFGGAESDVFFIGDSHAAAVVTAMARGAGGKSVMLWAQSGCPFILGLQRTHHRSPHCLNFQQQVLARLRNDRSGRPIFVLNRWTLYALGFNPNEDERPGAVAYFDEAEGALSYVSHVREAVIHTLCTLISTGHPVFAVKPIPELPVHAPHFMARQAMWTKHSVDIDYPESDYAQRHQLMLAALEAASRQCGVRLLDPLPWLCPQGHCRGSIEGRPLYFDDDHLSEYGNSLLIPMFKQALDP